VHQFFHVFIYQIKKKKKVKKGGGAALFVSAFQKRF
jgi:hypothetical protein